MKILESFKRWGLEKNASKKKTLVELDEAVRYYDHQLPGLSFRFYQEVEAAIERIKLMPDEWTKIGRHMRRCTLIDFPYVLLYAVETDAILIQLSFIYAGILNITIIELYIYQRRALRRFKWLVCLRRVRLSLIDTRLGRHESWYTPFTPQMTFPKEYS